MGNKNWETEQNFGVNWLHDVQHDNSNKISNIHQDDMELSYFIFFLLSFFTPHLRVCLLICETEREREGEGGREGEGEKETSM